MPKKYDLEKFEADIRASFEQVREATKERQETGLDVDLDFSAAQRAFDEARIQFSLAPLRLANDGINDQRIIAAGAGIALGLTIASILSDLSPEAQVNFLYWMQKSYSDGTPDGPEGEINDGSATRFRTVEVEAKEVN